jgi:hypothetical protein
MNIIKRAFIEKNENSDKSYSVRIVKGESSFFVFVNNDQRVKFNTLAEAEIRFNELVNHVSPKVPPPAGTTPHSTKKQLGWKIKSSLMRKNISSNQPPGSNPRHNSKHRRIENETD